MIVLSLQVERTSDTAVFCGLFFNSRADAMIYVIAPNGQVL